MSDSPVLANIIQERSVRDRLVRVLRRDKYLYLLITLPTLYYFLFHYVPMYGILMAFKDYNVADGILGSRWVGLKYFIQFLSNPYSYKLIRNTVLLRGFQILLGFPAPIVLALLMNEIRRSGFKRFVQSASYFPHFISLVVVAGMVVNFLSYDGLLNRIIVALGGQSKAWLMSPEWFRTIFIASGVWQEAGWASIIYLAGLSSIDPQLYEAAIIDGAGRIRRLIHITLPGIAPTVTIMLLLRMGTIMTVGYQKILLLYTGATYETADVLGTYIYRRGILGADFSFATAVGVFQALVGVIFIVSSNQFAKRMSDTSLW